ncbi:MAG TPA: alpha/beta hydrolase [Burkholderiaceae bacterium]|nr:alpha/beta hydrolase [Burkholderiaceae bacterium]
MRATAARHVVGALSIVLLSMNVSAEATLQEVRGARLYTQTFGNGAPLLFLHGGMHHFDNTFARQRDFFAAFRKVIGVDQRGHGRSPDTDAPLSYREMAEDTAALIRTLGFGPVDVVGHSDGANVALLLASRYPQLVRRVVVSGANLRAGQSATELARRAALPPEQIAERLAAFRADYVSVAPDGAQHWPIFAAKSWKLWLTPVVIEPAELTAIKAPVLVLAGDHDLTPPEETLEIYRGLAMGQLMILPATGHDTFGERAGIVNAAIRTFLEAPDAEKRVP